MGALDLMLTWKVKIVLINKRLWKSEMEMKGYGEE